MKIIARDPLATLRLGDDIDMEVGWLVGGGCCDSCCRCRCVSAAVVFFLERGGSCCLIDRARLDAHLKRLDPSFCIILILFYCLLVAVADRPH